MAVDSYVSPKLPVHGQVSKREQAAKHNMLCNGRSDARGSVTIQPGTVQTVVTGEDWRQVGEISVIHMMAKNQEASGLAWWVSARGNGSFTLGHATASSTAQFEASWQG